MAICIFGAYAGWFGKYGKEPFSGTEGYLILCWPTFLAFGFGCYSIYAAGVTLRNALAVLGIIASGTILVLGFRQLCLH